MIRCAASSGVAVYLQCLLRHWARGAWPHLRQRIYYTPEYVRSSERTAVYVVARQDLKVQTLIFEARIIQART